MYRRSIFLFPVFFLLFSFIQHAEAQDSAGITVVPASIEEGADPGAVLQRTLKVTNDSDIEKEFYLYKKNIKGVEGGGVPIFAKDEAEVTGYELSEWVEISTDPIKVPPRSSIDVPLSIRVPDNATPGSHFGGVFVSAEPPKLRETGAGVGYEVACIISIRISGDVVDTARIRSFSTDKLLYSKKDVIFNAKIENQGNILIRPYGPVTITGMFGGKPTTITVNENLAGVFPGTMRDITFNWSSDEFGFGKYEAVLALMYDGNEGQKTIDATLVFWVFPMKAMLAILGSIITVVVLGYVLTKYYINRAIIRSAGGRRIVSPRYKRQVGISRFAFVFTALMATVVIFLLILLIFSA